MRTIKTYFKGRPFIMRFSGLTNQGKKLFAALALMVRLPNV